MDTSVLQAAQQIFETHLQLRSEMAMQLPTGVVIHRYTMRGDLIFSEYPVLLPHELFVPMDLLQPSPS